MRHTKPTKGTWNLRETWRFKQGIKGAKRFSSPVHLDAEGTCGSLAAIYLCGAAGLRTQEAAANASLIVTAKKLQDAVEHVLIASEDGGTMNDISWGMLRDVLHESRTACPFEP